MKQTCVAVIPCLDQHDMIANTSADALILLDKRVEERTELLSLLNLFTNPLKALLLQPSYERIIPKECMIQWDNVVSLHEDCQRLFEQLSKQSKVLDETKFQRAKSEWRKLKTISWELTCRNTDSYEKKMNFLAQFILDNARRIVLGYFHSDDECGYNMWVQW